MTPPVRRGGAHWGWVVAAAAVLSTSVTPAAVLIDVADPASAAGTATAVPWLDGSGIVSIDANPVPLSLAPTPKHLYAYGVPYRWSGPIAWRYNDAGRPANVTKSQATATIDAAARKWTAACNISIIQDPQQPETSTPPQNTSATAVSPNENVIGWGDMSSPPYGAPQVASLTFLSMQSGRLIDADITLSSQWVVDASALERIIVHELGHALGLWHSNVEAQVMSGPDNAYNPGVPPTQFSGNTGLGPDDVQGCLCLYGPSAANAGKGYLCDLPSYRDFGNVPVDGSSTTQSVTLRNAAATGSVRIDGITFSSGEFTSLGGCEPGTMLAPGDHCTLEIAFRPYGAAGSREAFVQIATDSLGPYAFPLLGTATAAVESNHQGLWWNPTESGWGISFAHQGDIIFATWFTYDAQGKPWWLIAELHRGVGSVYTGAVSTVTGPPFGAAQWSAATETMVGTASVTFADGAHATLSYTVDGISRTKSIVPQQFGPLPACTWGAESNLALATNYTDLWWNASEPGWGINFTHQGDVIFATWYTYDAAGRPWWLIAELHQATGGTYTGAVATVVGPPFDATGWTPVTETAIGTASVAFADGNAATFAYTVNAVTQSKAIARQVFVAPGTVCR